jgi:S1-C subfamily serine protease
MKKLILATVAALILMPLQGQAASVNQELKGRILLQVESRGEAWYVSPDDSQRIYLKDGETAYNLMRNSGLGIADADLSKIPVGLNSGFEDIDTDQDGLFDDLEKSLNTDPEKADTDGDGYADGMELSHDYSPLGSTRLVFDNSLVNKLKGRILLQVQSRGQAWYVNPTDGRRYYLKNGAAAYQIMKHLSLGIRNDDLSRIPMNKNSQVPVIGERPAQPEPEEQAVEVAPAPVAEVPVQEAPAQEEILNDEETPVVVNEAKTLLTNAEIINQLKPSVAYIQTNYGSGSGFVISADGEILTNAHVVEGVSTSTVKMYNNDTYLAEVVARDELHDVALLRVGASNLTPVELGDSDEMTQGDRVFSFGYPFGIEGDVSFKDGTISRNQSVDDIVYFETSVDMHPGNSGGPLVNGYGEVVGINTFIYGLLINGLPVGESLKFSLPINTVKEILPDLEEGVNISKYSNMESYVTAELVPETFTSTVIPIGTNNVPMMKLKFTSSYDREIRISGLVFKRNGVIDNTEFSSASLLVDGRIIGSGNFVEDRITFTNLPLFIPANSSMEISLQVTVAFDYSIYFHQVYLTVEDSSSFTVDVPVLGDFPIQGRSIVILD